MKKSHIIIFLLVFFTNLGYAAHIVGGKLRATYINPNRIQIQLELERDCSGGGASFENFVLIGIYSNTNSTQVYELRLPRVTVISSPFSFDCNGQTRCLEVGYFSTIINTNAVQFDDTNGYYLHWERCCLTDELSNIANPGSTPFSALLEIPKIKLGPTDSTLFINSSPFKTEIFNPLICLNQNVALDLGFDDIDGDSIVYELITPIAGGYTSEFNPGQNTGPKPYDDIEWAIGFDLINPIESSSGFAFNTNTGLMTFTPTQLGKFLFSIAVHEYRNNKKIGTVYYESMLFVYDCSSAIILQPKEQYSIDHTPVTFRVKHSDINVTYQWQLKTPQDFTFSNIANATSDSLVISQVVDSMNNYQYRCIMHKSTCNDISLAASLRIKGLGIEKSNSNKIILYPNPTKNLVSIKGIENPTKISVYSLNGKLLKEIFNALSVDVSDLEPGMYLVRATDEKNDSNYYGKLRVEN